MDLNPSWEEFMGTFKGVRALIVEPGKEPYVFLTSVNGKELRSILGEHTEFMRFDAEDPAVRLCVTADPLLMNFPLNRFVHSDYHTGTKTTLFGVPVYGAFAVVCLGDAGTLENLADSHIAKYTKAFRL
jgi:hypothetical protein